jgi:hypothetical protein
MAGNGSGLGLPNSVWLRADHWITRGPLFMSASLVRGRLQRAQIGSDKHCDGFWEGHSD